MLFLFDTVTINFFWIFFIINGFVFHRTVGVAHVEDFKDSEFGEQEALGAGIRLLQAVDRIETVDKLMVIALMLA